MSREKPITMSRLQKVTLERVVSKYLPKVGETANFSYREGVREFADVRETVSGKLLAKFVWYPDKQIWVPIPQAQPKQSQQEVQNARS